MISGLFKFHRTYGVTLEDSIPYIKSIGMVPDWIDIFNEAYLSGISWNNFRSRLSAIIVDTYGFDLRNHILGILDKLVER